jgi:tRNA threonylcarbamoyladenosine biosynthesis protein TsaE
MITTGSREETILLGEKIAERCTPGTVIALRGGLGTGKTTLVQGIARGLGVLEIVTSPTFVIIAEYEGRLPLHHLDLYRISGETEFEDLGAEELLYGGGVSVIEWSERIEQLLPGSSVTIAITVTGPETREFSIQGLRI